MVHHNYENVGFIKEIWPNKSILNWIRIELVLWLIRLQNSIIFLKNALMCNRKLVGFDAEVESKCPAKAILSTWLPKVLLGQLKMTKWWSKYHASFFLSSFSREPDIPAWAPILYQLQLQDIRDKPDPLALPIADRIRIGNQKRERGNFHFQREEYSLAAMAYCVALEVLTTRSTGIPALKQ